MTLKNYFLLSGKIMLWAGLSTTITVTSAFAQPRPTIIPATSTEMSLSQKLQNWGFIPIACHADVVFISHQNQQICVQPTPELPQGNYYYDSSSNKIQPVSSGSLSNELSPDSVSANNVFAFTNLYDYSSCLDDILRLYQGQLRRENEQIVLVYPTITKIHTKKSQCIDKIIDIYGNQLSLQQAYELLDLANFRATKLLETSLFPPKGIRQRATQLLGFVYEIDRSDAETLELVPSTLNP